MPFTLSGTVITQTGVEDLTGLDAIAGVVSIHSGTDTTHSQNVYDIGEFRLDVAGTLNIDAHHDMIISGPFATDAGVRVRNGGTLNINGKRTFNGTDRYTESLWLHCTDEDRWQDVGLEVHSGGTLNWIGGGAFVPRGVEWDNGSIINIEGAMLDMATTDDNNVGSPNQHQIRQSSQALNINGFKLKRGFFTLIAIPQTLNNYAPEHSSKAFAFSSLTPNVDIPVFGYSTAGDNTQDVSLWAGARPVFTNAVQGTAMLVGPNSGGSAFDFGFVVVQQEFNPLILDDTGAPIEGASIWLSDYDNGAREPYTREEYLTTAGLQVDTDQTFIYEGVTNSTGQLPSDLTIYTGFNAINNGSTFFTPNASPGDWDYRGRSNDSSDEFDIFVASYPHLLTQYTAVMKGSSVVETGTTLFIDSLVTETNREVVSAYTSIDTAQQFYDRALLWRVQNPVGDTETIVVRSGNDIDARDYEVIIDPSQTTAFDFDGSTITINSTGFAGNIRTTASVTLVNGGEVNGGIVDQNGARVTFVSANGQPFNMLAVRADTGAELPFVDHQASVSFQVPVGVSIIYAVWQSGHNTQYGTVNSAEQQFVTILEAPLPVVDVNLDVSSILPTIDVSLASGTYDLIFNTPLVINIEQTKTTVHYILGQENSLRALISTGGMSALSIESDEIRVNLPAVFVKRGPLVPIADRVEITGFINVAPAQVINPTYVINPSNADGTFILLPSVKAELDPTQLASAVWDEIRGIDTLANARAANRQTKTDLI